MSNILPPGLRDDYTDVRVHDALVRARAWRAHALRQGFRALVDGIEDLAGLARRWYARRMAYAHLMAMDARALDDIGLIRGEIHDAVHGRQVANGEALGRALKALGRRYATWRRRQVARQELLSLDDRLLKDIGLHRDTVEAAIRGTNLPGLEADNENRHPAANRAA